VNSFKQRIEQEKVRLAFYFMPYGNFFSLGTYLTGGSFAMLLSQHLAGIQYVDFTIVKWEDVMSWLKRGSFNV
jgi:hypothetical protein